MFKDIKRRLLDNPDSIINILEQYDFYKPRIHNNEIRCGLYEGSNPTAIRIKLTDNDNLYVCDFSRNISEDIINYLIKVRELDFKTVLSAIKQELGIKNFYTITEKRSVFGGFYNRISRFQSAMYVKTYPENILDEYNIGYNKRFLDDNISLQTQDYFDIGYDVVSQRITIPIRNAYAEIIGLKGRANYEVTDDEPKYLYLISCPMSQTLYGFSQNYAYLCNGEIYLYEAEKSVLQCHTYGYSNALALGSNSLSDTQCRLLMGLQPKKIVFMLDKGLDINNTLRNIEKLLLYTRMSDVQICYWDWHKNTTLPDKASPSDYGKDMLQDIINNELVEYKCESEEMVI